MLLKKDLISRAYMLYKNKNILGVSPKVHNALKDTTAATLSDVVRELVKDGELITLRQFAYYCNQLGLQIDTTNNYLELDENAYVERNEFDYYNLSNELVLKYNPQTNTNMVFNNDYHVVDASLWIDAFTVVVHVEPVHFTICITKEYRTDCLEDEK